MIKPTLSLLVICFAVALCLSFVNSMTENTIAERIKSDAELQRKQVMTDAKTFEEVKEWQTKDDSGIIREAYAAFDGEQLIGYVFGVVPKGYGGDMQVTVGVKTDKTISGIQIGDNKETPGLGTKAKDEKFKGQFVGKDIEKKLYVVKHAASADNEVEAISGATITTNAVTSAIQAAANLGDLLLKDGGKREK